jgi:hypothetical protein
MKNIMKRIRIWLFYKKPNKKSQCMKEVQIIVDDYGNDPNKKPTELGIKTYVGLN